MEKQIAKAEGCLDQLSEYEKMRLENMKERQVLLEQLDIDQEKKEIAEERQKSMIFTPKEEVERRAPSPRMKALKEQKRKLSEEQRKVESQITTMGWSMASSSNQLWEFQLFSDGGRGNDGG